jgi:hypothetical protein
MAEPPAIARGISYSLQSLAFCKGPGGYAAAICGLAESFLATMGWLSASFTAQNSWHGSSWKLLATLKEERWMEIEKRTITVTDVPV